MKMNPLTQTLNGYKNIIGRLNAQIAELDARARQLERDSRISNIDNSAPVSYLYAEIAKLEAQRRRVAHEMNELLLRAEA